MDPACIFRMLCGLGKRDEAAVHCTRLSVASTGNYLHKPPLTVTLVVLTSDNVDHLSVRHCCHLCGC